MEVRSPTRLDSRMTNVHIRKHTKSQISFACQCQGYERDDGRGRRNLRVDSHPNSRFSRSQGQGRLRFGHVVSGGSLARQPGSQWRIMAATLQRPGGHVALQRFSHHTGLLSPLPSQVGSPRLLLLGRRSTVD